MGIYELIRHKRLRLFYSTPNEIYTIALRLNTDGPGLFFAQKIDGASDGNMILSLELSGRTSPG